MNEEDKVFEVIMGEFLNTHGWVLEKLLEESDVTRILLVSYLFGGFSNEQRGTLLKGWNAFQEITKSYSKEELEELGTNAIVEQCRILIKES